MIRFVAFLIVFLLCAGCSSTDDAVSLPTDEGITLPAQASPSAVGQKVFYGEAT